MSMIVIKSNKKVDQVEVFVQVQQQECWVDLRLHQSRIVWRIIV